LKDLLLIAPKGIETQQMMAVREPGQLLIAPKGIETFYFDRGVLDQNAFNRT